MAKIRQSAVATIQSQKVSRPGVHSKTKSSSHKGSKNYKKKYRGQGR